MISDLLPQLGAAGILALAVLLVLTGRLVPRSVVRDVRADRDARVASAERAATEWREANAATAATVADLAEQVREMTAIGQTTVALLSSLHKESAA